MKKILVPAVLVLPFLWAAAAPRDRVEFRVGSDLELTKTFKLRTELSQDSLSTLVNGNEADMGDMEMNVVSDELTTVTDVYGAMAEGRPAKLKRTYDKLTNHTTVDLNHPMMGEKEMEYTGKSGLEGKTEVFALGDDGEYQVAFAEGDKADEELLSELWEDMDLRLLLPKGEVKAGDTWKIEETSLAPLLAPGGNLKVLPETEGNDMMGGAQPGMSEMLGEVHAQEATGTYVGTEERGGTTVGVIKLKLVKVKSAKDMTEFARKALEAGGLQEGLEMSIDSADVEIELDGEGELVWDLKGGHIHSLDLSGTLHFTQDSTATMAMQGQKMKIESTSEMSGSFTRSVALGASD